MTGRVKTLPYDAYSQFHNNSMFILVTLPRRGVPTGYRNNPVVRQQKKSDALQRKMLQCVLFKEERK